MNERNTRLLRLCMLSLLVVGVSLMTYRIWSVRTSLEETGTIPTTGYAANDTSGKILGDPQNGVDDLKRIYLWTRTYRQRHNGEYPASLIKELIADIHKAPRDYGLSSLQDAVQILKNPDSKYGDVTKHRPDSIFPYSVIKQRPDGTKNGSIKKNGTKDAIAFCPLYSFANVRIFRGERSTENPVGFNLVLWEDGEVTRVPYNKMLFAPVETGNNREFNRAFPGQSGVSDNALTYDEYYKRLGWKNGGPRGSEGAKGQSYDTDRG